MHGQQNIKIWDGCVCCAVRTESLNILLFNRSPRDVIKISSNYCPPNAKLRPNAQLLYSTTDSQQFTSHSLPNAWHRFQPTFIITSKHCLRNFRVVNICSSVIIIIIIIIIIINAIPVTAPPPGPGFLFHSHSKSRYVNMYNWQYR